MSRNSHTIGEITEKLIQQSRKGKPPGYEVGFQHWKEKLTIMPGYHSMWYGHPESGKTRLLLQIMVLLAKRYRLQFYVNTFEEGDPEDVYRLLLCIWLGQPLIAANYDRAKLTEQEIHHFMPEIYHHFYVEPDAPDSMGEIVQRCDDLDSEGRKIFGVLVDPLNFVIPMSGAIAQNYADALKICTLDARKKKRHYFLLTHPADQRDKERKNGEMVFAPVHASELAGGQNLWRMGYLMVSVYRRKAGTADQSSLTGANFYGNEVDLIVQKAKPEGSAVKNEKDSDYRLHYSSNHFNYYEIIDGKKHFANDIITPATMKPEHQAAIEFFKPNTKFDEAKKVNIDEDDDLPF